MLQFGPVYEELVQSHVKALSLGTLSMHTPPYTHPVLSGPKVESAQSPGPIKKILGISGTLVFLFYIPISQLAPTKPDGHSHVYTLSNVSVSLQAPPFKHPM